MKNLGSPLMDEPSAKRSKRSDGENILQKRGDDDYLPGNITMIELHNFMTFEYVTSKPAPRLNIVVGPNGSGKSSLVCAFALGLGGEPQLLGRASNVSAFVKRGESSGYIKITLKSDRSGEFITITRKINTENKSEWLLNGKVVPKREILQTTQKFNIQVNNLTQFLPQDRVCEFAKLTPVQLLEETEKAVGDPQLPILHHTLTAKSSEFKKLEVAVKQNGDTLNHLKALNAEQEKDVERVRQREELLGKVESMKKKLPWLKYDQKKSQYMDTKKEETAAARQMEEAAKVLSNLQRPIEEQRKAKAAQDAECKKISNLIAKNSTNRMEMLDKESRFAVQVRGNYDEMEELRRQEKSRQQRISIAKEELAEAEQALENLPIYESPKDELEALGRRIVELENSTKDKRFQQSEKQNLLNLTKRQLMENSERLRDMEQASNRLLQALKRSGADKIQEAYRWLQDHRQELKKEVYGPVLLEVTVPNREHASYLEGQVAGYIWKSIVTQDADDRDFLVRSLRQYDVPVLNYTGGRTNGRGPFQPSEGMQKLGIYSRLDQVFDGPIAVKEVLIGQSGLDNSYIGNQKADEHADQVPHLGIQDLWTPENHYRWNKSRYGGHISASVDSVNSSRLLLCSVDAGEIENIRSKKGDLERTIAGLEEICRKLQSEQNNLEDEAAQFRRQREGIHNTIQQEKRKRRELENRINQKRLKLDSILREDDLESNLKKLVDEAAKLNTQRFHLAVNMKKLLVEAVSLKRSFAENHMMYIELEAKIREMERNIKEQEKAAVTASLHFETCKQATERSREQLSSAKRHAESIAKLTPELSEEFLQMPTTIEELEAAIQDNISQANSIMFLNHNILEEYESRQQKIETIGKKLEADEEELKRCVAEIDSLKEKWLPTLRNLVAQINKTFGKNFQEMAVAGEVLLDEHEMDFDKYGILIKVKFRQAGQLQVLSASHQSGGERSVSTILYLVSLQDLTNCPFRVVDEINQGMDPINERKMFQQLVRAASQLNTPQCFLLTPKLLPDLEYSEACSVLTMMNGPWIECVSKVWSKGDNWGTVMGSAGEGED